MERVIKFRGKRVDNGEWVYGLLTYMNVIRVFTTHTYDYGEYDTTEDTSVDKDTVGQFTGLHDKRGDEIYEGDVFGEYSSQVGEFETIGYVVYDSDLCAFVVRKSNGGWEYLGKFLIEEKRVEVIATIHDTPHQ